MVGEFLLLPKPAPHQSRSIILFGAYKYIYNCDSNSVYDTTQNDHIGYQYAATQTSSRAASRKLSLWFVYERTFASLLCV